MDGFNVIPVDKESFKNTIGQAASLDSSVEILDEEKEKTKLIEASKLSWFFVFGIMSIIGVVGYFGFLVFSRIDMLSQIADLSSQLNTVAKNIDVKEMQNFQAMDVTLKTINGKLATHVLNYEILNLVNQNIRNSLQITEYRLDTKDKEVEVNLTAIAPSFKELAEQTEKFFVLKDDGQIKSFSVSNLTFESDTKRLKFNIRIIFDKSKVSAGAIAAASDAAIQQQTQDPTRTSSSTTP